MTLSNHQHVVLAVLRYTLDSAQATFVDSLNDTPVLYDRRVYVRSSPFYLQHMSKGGSTVGTGLVDAANAIDSHTDLDTIYPATENGEFTDSFFGAMWQSHSSDTTTRHTRLYYAASRDVAGTPTTHTHRLGPDDVSYTASQGAATITFTFDDANIFIFASLTGIVNLNPSGTFPHGHVVEVYHTAGAFNLNFESGGLNENVAATEYAKFVYNETVVSGSNWLKLDKHVVS